MAHTTTASTTTASTTTAQAAARCRRLPRRARFALPVLVIGLACAGVACAPPSSPGGGFTGNLANAVNQDRAAAGLAPLIRDAQLGPVAANWADHLAATGTLTHSDLHALIRLPYMSAWRALGENLLVGPGNLGSRSAESLWMSSTEHRAAILDPAYNRIGVGAARDPSGRLWIVAEFGAR